MNAFNDVVKGRFDVDLKIVWLVLVSIQGNHLVERANDVRQDHWHPETVEKSHEELLVSLDQVLGYDEECAAQRQKSSDENQTIRSLHCTVADHVD